MLGKRSDQFYDARLVETARLQLSLVMEAQQAPIFFETMIKIIQRNVHHGYITVQGKQAKLRGMKDFLHNFTYGLGIRDMVGFLAKCAEVESKDRSKERRSREFIDWLQKDDPVAFQFPAHYWELRRVRLAIARLNMPADKKRLYWNVLRIIYNTKPEVMKDIGTGRKYRTVIKAYCGEGYTEAPQTLTPIKLYRRPTSADIEKLAVDLNSRLDKLKNRQLIAKLIEIYKINTALEEYANRSAPADSWPEI